MLVLYLRDTSWRSSLREQKKNTVADFVFQMGFALPVAILVAVSAGRRIHRVNSRNMETEIQNLAIDVLKDQIVEKLQIVSKVYKPTGLLFYEFLFFILQEFNSNKAVAARNNALDKERIS